MKIQTLQKILKMSALGDGVMERLCIFGIIFLRLVCAKVGLPIRPVSIRVCVNGVSCSVCLGDRPDDMWVFDEVLVQEEYKVTEVVSPRVIVDAGGNIGLSAIYFATRFPEATVYTIEADPETFQRLKANTAQCNNIVPINAALTARDGEDLFFYRGERSVASSLRRRSPTDIEVRVKSVSIDGIMSTYGIGVIDICKFDIEGGEADAFAIGDLSAKIRFCIGEVHGDLMPVSRTAFLGLFSGYTTTIMELGKDRFILRASALPVSSTA